MNFKSKFFIFIIIMCILFTVTGVCASDNNTDIVNADDNYELDNEYNQDLKSVDESFEDMQSTDADNLKSNPNGEGRYTFDDLHHDITASGMRFDMQHNYTYDENDDGESIFYYVPNLEINGNGFTIDSANSGFYLFFAREDSLQSSLVNITISNMTFRNFNATALVFNYAKVTLSDVKFINCSSFDDGIVKCSLDSNFTLNNCYFDSTRNCSSFLQIDNSYAFINNTYFNGDKCSDSAILQDRGQLTVENCRFENFHSPRAKIINYKGDFFQLEIQNSSIPLLN